MDFSSKTTRFGLVLSAVKFFAHGKKTMEATRHIIEILSPLTLVNFSCQSDWLFPRASMPAVVLLAKRPLTERAEITTVQVPWSPAGKRTHTFEIARDDMVALPLVEWRRKPELLKATFFGVRRDLALLDKITSGHARLANQMEEMGTKLNLGLTRGKPEKRRKNSMFLNGMPLLTKGGLRPFSIDENLELYKDEKAVRPRVRENYRAPLLLVPEFLTNQGRLSVVVSDHDVVFTDAFFSAAWPSEQVEIAHMLAAILSSSLTSWYLLMTGSTLGLSVPRAKIRDIGHMPVPDLQRAERLNAGQRLIRIAQELRGRTRDDRDDDDWRVLDETVLDLYGLDDSERIVVQDGLFRVQWLWKSGRLESAAAACPGTHVRDYACAFLDAIDVWLSAANRHRMRGEVFNLPQSAPLRIVRFVLEEKNSTPSAAEIVSPDGSLRQVLDRIGERLDVRLGDYLIGQRALRIYGPDEVVIVKPAARRHWMGVSALEDADAVVVESLSGPMA